MSAMPLAQRMTADEFLALPERQSADRLDLVDGEVIVEEATSRHNAIQRELLYAFEVWVRGSPDRGGVWLPLDVRLDERNVFAPDLLWYSPERNPRPSAERPSPLPDLAAEVRSPSTWAYDIGAKRSTYEHHGLGELWLLDTVAAEVIVFRRSRPDARSFDVALELGRGDTLGSPMLAGFAVAVDDLFPA
jgi:Uma2 family endonuclease